MKEKNLNKLLTTLEKLKKSHVKDLVKNRIKEFEENGKKTSKEIFKELCFCILTANSNAERCIRISEEINDGFLNLPEPKLSRKLKLLGHRYPKTRARYIVKARKYADSLKEMIEEFEDGNELREWLVKNVKGIGYKEASHFLRNIGFTSFAIVDFHIINILTEHGLIEKPKTITRRKYFEIEEKLRRLAEKLEVNLAELDLYLWYLETGKILK